jgi:ATP-binding cassette subfamily C (CFTR/MRP) protein 10
LRLVRHCLTLKTFSLLGILAITCYGLPYFVICLFPLGLLYYHIQRYYRQTSREIKRLQTISRSPIYAHFSETLSGAVTVRALRAAGRFTISSRARLDVNQVSKSNCIFLCLEFDLGELDDDGDPYCLTETRIV